MSVAKNTSPRPTGIVLLADYFKQQMNQTESVLIRGRRRKVPLLEVTARRLMQQALKGDERALQAFLKLVKKAEKWRTLQPKPLTIALNPADAAL